MSVPAYSAQRPFAERRGRAARGGPGRPLGLALACALAMALVWGLAEHVASIRAEDATLLYRMTQLDRPSIEAVGHPLLRALEPGLFILWSSVVVAVGLVRRRAGRALAAAAVLGLAPLTAEVLKPLLAHPHDAAGALHIGPASWPSGHATAALALAGAAVLVAPERLRPLVAGAGAALAAAVGLVLVILAWHMPSDVLGGYLVAGFWLSLALAAVRTAKRRAAPAAR